MNREIGYDINHKPTPYADEISSICTGHQIQSRSWRNQCQCSNQNAFQRVSWIFICQNCKNWHDLWIWFESRVHPSISHPVETFCTQQSWTNTNRARDEAESRAILKTTREECEIQFIMQTILESYNSTMCEHNAVFWPPNAVLCVHSIEFFRAILTMRCM